MNRLNTDAALVATAIFATGLMAGTVLISTVGPEPTTLTVTAPPVTQRITLPPKVVTRTVEVTRASRSSQRVHPDRALIWKRIAQCESSGRLHAVSASGTYRGLYQLHRGFFTTFGYRGDAWRQASAVEQLRIAEYVQRRQGWKAWPVCSRKAGIR